MVRNMLRRTRGWYPPLFLRWPVSVRVDCALVLKGMLVAHGCPHMASNGKAPALVPWQPAAGMSSQDSPAGSRSRGATSGAAGAHRADLRSRGQHGPRFYRTDSRDTGLPTRTCGDGVRVATRGLSEKYPKSILSASIPDKGQPANASERKVPCARGRSRAAHLRGSTALPVREEAHAVGGLPEAP
jgi:hypothetical protein